MASETICLQEGLTEDLPEEVGSSQEEASEIVEGTLEDQEVTETKRNKEASRKVSALSANSRAILQEIVHNSATEVAIKIKEMLQEDTLNMTEYMRV
jgi:hypothetical protein